MNFNSLSSNEKLGLYGALAVIVGMLISSTGFFGFGLATLALLSAVAMLIVIFLPQMSGGSSLPGSKGTLMLATGIIAAAVLVITLIQVLGFIGLYLSNISGIFFLIAVVGSLAMAWAGWQELQSEGGSMRFGGTGSPASGGAPRSDASAAPAAPPPSSTPPAAPPPSSTPAASSWSDTSQPAAGSGGSGGGGSEGAPSSGSGMGGGSPSGMGSSAPASPTAGSDMGSDGGPSGRRDDEGPPRSP